MKAGRVFGLLLQAVGALAIVAIAAVVFLIWRAERAYVRDEGEPFSRDALVPVLKWAGADPSKAWSIIASSMSPRSFTGDHDDFACIQLAEFDPSADREWSSGKEVDSLLEAVLGLALGQAKGNAECLPTLAQASSGLLAYRVHWFTFHARVPTAAIVYLYDPATKRLYYLDFKT